ncbi:MAG: 4Fe-4S dicluster domain-containing protein [Planctomycetota bacterium]|nr:MAG: 4Fe-4S dicluster domain-containing protein [Planctomycetota bacterium]
MPAGKRIQVQVPDERYWQRQIKCQEACPVHTDARGYVRAIASGDFETAYLIARGPNPLASICGRVCGAPCEASCRRGDIDQPISIRALKRSATERYGPEARNDSPLHLLARVLERGRRRECLGPEELASLERISRRLNEPLPDDAPQVAIIGSGPAGLAAAHDLALLGIRAVVFEMEPIPAGMLAVGIPAYRLPRDLIRAEVAVIESLGVEFRCNTQVGKDITLDEIRAQFAATIIAVGAKRSRALPIPGADGPGVFGGVELLREVALKRPVQLGERIVVIGGGNVAYDVARSVIRQAEMDVSRTALRQTGVREVHMVSLESLEEMPADDVEIIEGDEEGVQRHHRLGPKEILRDEQGRVRAVVFKRVLRVFDEQGRFAPLFDENDTITIPCDTVLWAIGQRADVSFVPPDSDIRLDQRGLIDCDADACTTSAPDVFVAGDIATGPRLLIHAVASGKRAARVVCEHLTQRGLREELAVRHLPVLNYRREADYEKHPRVAVPTVDPAQRIRAQDALVEAGYSAELACREASRCLDCGVNTIFDSDKCILCGGCADICPELCLRLVSVTSLAGDVAFDALLAARYSPEELADASAIIKDESKCIRCALCAERCPVDAITMERMTFAQRWVEATP